MSKKADKFIEKYIVGKDDWLLKHKEVISRILDEYESEQLTIPVVVSMCCDETRKVNQFLKRPSKYCMTCSKELN